MNNLMKLYSIIVFFYDTVPRDLLLSVTVLFKKMDFSEIIYKRIYALIQFDFAGR